MKTSPFKVIAGGVADNEVKSDPKPDINKKIVDNITDFITPDSVGEALMNFIPFGGVAGKSKVIQNIVKKVPGLSKLFKSGTTITKNQKINFQKGLDDGLKAKGGVSGEVKDYKLPNYGKFSEANKQAMQDMLRKSGAELDNFVKGKPPYVYNKQNTKLLGSDDGRLVVEVKLPNGGTQKFYKSTGLGKKIDSKDRWIPVDGSQTRNGKEWFNKHGSQATYKGEKYKGYENNAGEYVSVETQLKAKGVNIKEAMKKGDLKVDESGYDFDYGSKEFRNISKQLSNIY
jgi:hypothetical protein